MSLTTMQMPNCKTTILTRAVILIAALALLNGALWIVTALCFSDRLLSLALLAWTLGLRHGLDSDHIASIDNSVRKLTARNGIYPVTVGFFFAAGHSTVVLIVTIALVAGAQVYDNLNTLEQLGGVVGSVISTVFLMLLGVTNSFTLWQAIQSRKEMQFTDTTHEDGNLQPKSPSFLSRLFSPLLNWVDRPSKLYVIGCLFSLGFDTTSSMVLLSVSALAAEEVQKPYSILLFPLLFASGMILVDSLDNVMMLYLYTPRTDWRRESHFKLEFGEGKNSATDRDETASLIDSGSEGSRETQIQNTEYSGLNCYVRQQKMLDLNKSTILITALSVCFALG
ncbi:hypothetical protein E3P81_00496 [Wallemia ichthyophaga]|nr:hypothetical protein E3P97_00498 [Wallemia ichthyophaga]TIB53953.1 hypothetical protein E3P81_00496 [Wallemia ichthyophaga]